MEIRRYHSSNKSQWDDFVRQSVNATFLFYRGYMDYHRDRFQDYSLLIFDNDQLIALLPATCDERNIRSHGGLTYGGFLIGGSMKSPIMLTLFENVLIFFKTEGYTAFEYRTIPYCYSLVPAEADRYALFLCDATLIRRSMLIVSDQRQRLPFQERRTRSVKKARKYALTVRQSSDLALYWELLTEVLQTQHGSNPVHSLAEMTTLQSLFPLNIKLFACYQDSVIIAGVLIYETERVARAQYIAANAQGRSVGALDLLFDTLLNDIYAAKPYFDFGSSDEQNGMHLNKGLIDQKEGFGARAVSLDYYRIELDSWHAMKLQRALLD